MQPLERFMAPNMTQIIPMPMNYKLSMSVDTNFYSKNLETVH